MKLKNNLLKIVLTSSIVFFLNSISISQNSYSYKDVIQNNYQKKYKNGELERIDEDKFGNIYVGSYNPKKNLLTLDLSKEDGSWIKFYDYGADGLNEKDYVEQGFPNGDYEEDNQESTRSKKWRILSEEYQAYLEKHIKLIKK